MVHSSVAIGTHEWIKWYRIKSDRAFNRHPLHRRRNKGAIILIIMKPSCTCIPILNAIVSQSKHHCALCFRLAFPVRMTEINLLSNTSIWKIFFSEILYFQLCTVNPSWNKVYACMYILKVQITWSADWFPIYYECLVGNCQLCRLFWIDVQITKHLAWGNFESGI